MDINNIIEQNFGIIIIIMAAYIIIMTGIMIFNDFRNKNKPRKKTEIEEEKPKNMLKLYPLYSLRGFLDFLKTKFYKNKIMLVNMELLTGYHRSIIVKDKGGYFTYDKKSYLIDNGLKYWNLDAKLYCSDYHENISIPILRKIDIKDIEEAANRTEFKEIRYAFNPSTLNTFLVSKVTEGVIKSGELSEFMKKLLLIVIITGILVLIHLLLYAQKSGVFKSLPGMA